MTNASRSEAVSERYELNANDIAEKIEATNVAAWAWLLGLEFSHDSEAEDAKALVVEALRSAALRERPEAVPGWRPSDEEIHSPKARLAWRDYFAALNKCWLPCACLENPQSNCCASQADERLRVLLAASPPPSDTWRTIAVPGWRLVPEKPTEAMLTACEKPHRHRDRKLEGSNYYRAMYAASPSPTASETKKP